MKKAMQLIHMARQGSTLQKANLVLTFENGHVVDLYLDENIADKQILSQLTELFRPLTGAGFYGKLKLNCANDEIPLAKIEKTIKLS